MSLKLGNTGIDKSYLGSTEIKKAYLGSTLVFESGVIPIAPLYDNVSVMYTLRQPPMTTLWDKAVLRLRRSSDNDQKYVFFDGNGKISLSSATGSISSSPSATTLGTWVGVNDAYVSLWIGITPNNIIDTNKLATQGTTVEQPQFISSGVIITKNGEAAIDFLSTDRYLQSVANTDLDSGNSHTVFTVSSNEVLADFSAVLGTQTSNAPPFSRFTIVNSNITNLAISRLTNSLGTSYVVNTLIQNSTTNQKLLSAVTTNGNLKGYYNGVFQDSTVWTGSYVNNTLQIGIERTVAASLEGTIQEITIFPSDKTADLAELNTDINDYYNIY